MRILLTGLTGFVGSHLTELLLREGGHQLFGLSRSGRWPDDLKHLQSSVELIECELSNGPRLGELLRLIQPDWVFHLAGYANTGGSFKEPGRCWADNLTATQTLYDCLTTLPNKPRVIYASTGLIYGDPDSPDSSCTESTVLKPASPYAASKAATDLLSYQYFRNHGLNVLRVRLFNQFGPRQSPDFALASFARQIARAEAGRQEPIIRTGDLSAYRDLTDVRDMVRALRLLIEKGQAGEAYNAGSGMARPMRELLQQLVQHAKISLEIHEKIDPARPADTAISKADLTKLQQATGWEPKLSISQSLADLLDYWRTTIAASVH